jgi:hypothetical protein
MTDLMSMLQSVRPEPNLNLSPECEAEIARSVAANLRIVQPYQGEYRASWQLNDWSSPVWQTYGGKKTREIAGQWKGSTDINWAIVLPDGRNLTDPMYSRLLESCRRAAFLYREGLGDGKAPAPTTWMGFCRGLLSLCRWMVLHKQRYQVTEYGLSLLDQAGLRELYAALGQDGWTGALCLAERILNVLHQSAFGQPCPQVLLDNSGQLPVPVCDGIREWLESENAYVVNGGRGISVSRSFLADLMAAPDLSLAGGSVRLTAILRQLEPTLASPTGLLLSSCQYTELPSHRTEAIESALQKAVSPASVERVYHTLQTLLSLYRHLPDALPDPATINLAEAMSMGFQHCREEQRTPFIPIDTGLRYLNEAIRWVHAYGDALVDYFLAVVEKLIMISALSPRQFDERVSMILAETPAPPPLREINFKFEKLIRGSKSRDFDLLRTQPALNQALKVWVGAVLILIGILKPSRATELAHLPRHCLIGEGPYWLDSDLAKRTVREHRASTMGKPIPTITARAIQQIQRLGNRLAELYGETDRYKLGQLFYLPNFKTFGHGIVANKAVLNSCLDLFCDYVGLPPDELGRRWYIRVHEMRKWFLLLLFWSGRFDVLDAAREVAGHTNVSHLYAYIEREFPGVEFSRLEGEYAADRLRHYDQTRIAYDSEIGLNELYGRVLQHFRVEQLELIPEKAWHSYVQELRNDEAFRLEPYTLTDERGYQRLCVAFKSIPVEISP